MADHPLTRRLYLELGVRVRRHREALELTQDQLATKVGISRSSVANIERGQQHAPAHVLLGLSEALKVEMGALLPTHAELVALVGVSRDVPKLVNIGGESSLLTSDVVQLVGALLTQPTEFAPTEPVPQAHSGRRGRALPRSTQSTGED